jgi:hypothetical protein
MGPPEENFVANDDRNLIETFDATKEHSIVHVPSEQNSLTLSKEFFSWEAIERALRELGFSAFEEVEMVVRGMQDTYRKGDYHNCLRFMNQLNSLFSRRMQANAQKVVTRATRVSDDGNDSVVMERHSTDAFMERFLDAPSPKPSTEAYRSHLRAPVERDLPSPSE